MRGSTSFVSCVSESPIFPVYLCICVSSWIWGNVLVIVDGSGGLNDSLVLSSPSKGFHLLRLQIGLLCAALGSLARHLGLDELFAGYASLLPGGKGVSMSG